MNALLVTGIIFILTGLSFGLWVFHCGLVFLFGGLALFVRRKSWKDKNMFDKFFIGLMILVFVWGFVNEVWFVHPLGGIISLASLIWTFKLLKENKEEIK